MNLWRLFLHMEEIPNFEPSDEGVPVTMEAKTGAKLVLEEIQCHIPSQSNAPETHGVPYYV